MSYAKVPGVPNLYIRNGRYHHKIKARKDVGGSWPRLNATNVRDATREQETKYGLNVRQPAKLNVKARDAWPEFVAAKRTLGLAETTISRYEDMWRLHGVHVLGSLRMNEVAEENIKAVFDRMAEVGYVDSGGTKRAYASFRQAKTALSAFFSTMMQSPFRYVTHNPVKTLGLWSPKEMSLKPIGTWVVIREPEMEAIVKNALATVYQFSRINATAFKLGYGTGMRIGEIAGLPWSNVLFDEGRVLIAQQLAKKFLVDDPTTWFVPLKGDKDKSNSKLRYVPLSAEDLQMLREYREWLLSIGLYRGSGLVFPTRKHTPISHRSWDRRFEEAVTNAKLVRPEGKLTPHCMRHSYASRLFARRVPVGTISNLLGHSTEQITKDRYIHFYDRTAEDDIVRAALGG